MAEKTKAHSAGIYADMTVDGPEIGTLVIIVDRAKNLPNRKSIGKQDPYCAARLGKEAKKTNTDRRGGQTPKWDQELRFTVHDSPDYYQLKVSVFNDDKKTDLIGESWVNLQDVLVPGGGQNDLWHTLNYRGKYAGEIRIEITYYDTRPKQEKPRERVREGAPSAVEGGGARESLAGPRGPKEKVMKRRPLPSDPTGATPSPIETPERALPQPTRGYTNGTPDHPPQQPKMHAAPVPEYTQAPQPIAYNTPEHVQPPQQRPYATPEHVQVQQPRGSAYNTPPAYIQTHSPLQNLEYNTPTHVRTQSQVVQGRYGPSGMDQPPLQTDYNTPPPPHVHAQSHSKHVSPAINGYSQAPGMTPDRHHPRDLYNDRHDDYGQPENYNGSNVSSRHEDPYTRSRNDLRQEYAPQQMTYEPPPSDYDPPSSPEGPPPPPPVHRVHQTAAAPASSPGYGFPPPNPTAQFDHLRQENPRQSMPAYSQNAPQQPYTPPRQQHAPAPAPPPSSYGQQDHYQGSLPRHNSYDDRYHSSTFSSMQPTVEDAPPSPTPFATASHRASEPQMSQYGDRRYDDVPSPAPLNLNGGGSATSGNYKMNANAYASNAPHEVVDNRHADPYYDQPPPAPMDNGPRSYTQDPIEPPPQGGFMPSLPASLVAGFDPLIARGISDRIHSDTRPRGDSYTQFSTTPTHYAESPQSYQPAQPQYRDDYSQPQPQPSAYPQAAPSDRQTRGIPTATYTSVIKPHPISPHPPSPNPSPSHTHTVHRKSISPAPPSPSPRPLSSSVPFGPDDYSSLNPHVPAATATEDPDAKIILHDGREVDPSDHLPEASWAALPPNLQKKLDAAARQRGAAAGGARRMERRERPMSAYAEQTPPPVAQGRTRLQKKANRVSAAPSMPVGGSSPLAPISPNPNAYGSMPGSRDGGGRSLPRAQTGDWGGEGGYGGGVNGYSTGSPGYRGQSRDGGVPPPVPGKVPIGGGGAQRGEPQENAWALLEEMKSIDLGSGRARRRKGGAVV